MFYIPLFSRGVSVIITLTDKEHDLMQDRLSVFCCCVAQSLNKHIIGHNDPETFMSEWDYDITE